MDSDLSRRQKINTEIAEKAKNTKVKNILNKLLSKSDRTKEPIQFNCECSNPECIKKVTLTLSEYEKYNKKEKQFIIAKGHLTNEIEKPILKEKDFTIVKKFSLN